MFSVAHLRSSLIAARCVASATRLGAALCVPLQELRTQSRGVLQVQPTPGRVDAWRTPAVRPFAAQAAAGASKASSSPFAAHDTFPRRHIGPHVQDVEHMCKTIGVKNLEQLIDNTVPTAIRAKTPLNIKPGRGESELLQEFKAIMSQNKIFRSHIGAGYYGTITPPVILRNILENPGWYTPYTPYSAEIAQGRLEMLLNYQTMVCDLTGLPVSNASLLDEATAAAEALNLCRDSAGKKRVFAVSADVHPQTIAVLKTRAEVHDTEIRLIDPHNAKHVDPLLKDPEFMGLLVQYPSTDGRIHDYKDLTKRVHEAGGRVVVATDLLALTLLQPPGEWGADVVVGSAQRFGVPLGFGGPHAAFFAARDEHKRKLPGRIIGVSKDERGNTALRMALQTREQHIRRDKATSNICTAQALLANIAAAYAIYHGPDGLKQIATKVNSFAKTFAVGAQKLGYTVPSMDFFDTVLLHTKDAPALNKAAQAKGINLRVLDNTRVAVSFDETTRSSHLDDLFSVLASVSGSKTSVTADGLANANAVQWGISSRFQRSSEFLSHPVFHMYHSEHEMLRYLFRLQSKDLGLNTAMIPLGSCTMKLNATAEMIPVTWPEVGNIHPFAPEDQWKGYRQMLDTLSRDLCEVTGFHSISMQPNAGSQGEYAGLLVIRAYHRSRGDMQRDVCLIPVSAHGTNPASAVMAGMRVVVVACDEHGNIDVADLKRRADEHKQHLSCLMATYPSTHGVFEESIKEVCDIIHTNGGQVYMDGANMNAQVGLTSPGSIGADVCHLNLHKTFCIPHGGGGPGMGPIGVAKHLAPFLPSHPLLDMGGAKSAGAVAAAPFSSASILPISWMYINLMGGEGLTHATKIAILNANYMAARLRPYYRILYTGSHGFVAHEFIIDFRPIKAACGITEEDVAKRLMDFNFHAPTMSWPVVGTLMVEPTESESLYELDRFCDALIQIRQEIKEVEEGKADKTNNVLKRAPHPADAVLSDKWDRPYPREKAAYPLPYLRQHKFWPTVSRIDNVYGDRNVVCTCPPLEAYQDKA